jgi:hypothetical protein
VLIVILRIANITTDSMLACTCLNKFEGAPLGSSNFKHFTEGTHIDEGCIDQMLHIIRHLLINIFKPAAASKAERAASYAARASASAPPSPALPTCRLIAAREPNVTESATVPARRPRRVLLAVGVTFVSRSRHTGVTCVSCRRHTGVTCVSRGGPARGPLLTRTLVGVCLAWGGVKGRQVIVEKDFNQ